MANRTLAIAGVRNFRVICGYSMLEESHCGQRNAAPTSGSDASHSRINWCALPKSSSSTLTFTWAWGFAMKATRCRWLSPMISAPMPACWSRLRRCFAFDCSLKVAIVTMVLRAAWPRHEQTTFSAAVQDSAAETIDKASGKRRRLWRRHTAR